MGLIFKKNQRDIFQKQLRGESTDIKCIACYTFQKRGCLLNAADNHIQYVRKHDFIHSLRSSEFCS